MRGNLPRAVLLPQRCLLLPRPCTCGCHIGYVHLDYLELHKVFGAGLERIPTDLSAARISSP